MTEPTPTPTPEQLSVYQEHMMSTATTALGALVLGLFLLVFLVSIAVVRHL